MITTKKIKINDTEAEGVNVFTGNVNILLIKTKNGLLGCGYFDINVANKFDDVMAVVTGVKTFDDMLKAKVVKVSNKAKEIGVSEGMIGQDALELMS
ncbi:YunC family protein [Candidatus Woesearchaeota archaeon]|nr:YunC family protein [Candidatus Woesearchaeota archaeon]